LNDCETTNPLVRKLLAFAELTDDDCRLLEEISANPRDVDPRTDLIIEGTKPTDVHLILEGFACRYKILPNGDRHIMAYLVPGDFCDLHAFVLREMDHSVGTLSRCNVVDIPRQHILELTERPAITRAMWVAAMVDEATLREWLVNLAGREAAERLAHLLCELLYRLRAVGLANGGSYSLPLTQSELADSAGLSDVHMNRVLQRLRAENLITFEGHQLVIHDIGRMIAFSGFDPNYLHLQQLSGGHRDRQIDVTLPLVPKNGR
jgi:CRP-like cAMP-binding protein